MKPATQVLIERYQKHLYAIAFNICRNQQDAEDVVQDTFIQYHTYKKEFDTEEHIRAWLIRVAINKAKNITRSFWHRNKCNLEEYMETLTFETPESETLFDTVMKLPENTGLSCISFTMRIIQHKRSVISCIFLSTM